MTPWGLPLIPTLEATIYPFTELEWINTDYRYARLCICQPPVVYSAPMTNLCASDAGAEVHRAGLMVIERLVGADCGSFWAQRALQWPARLNVAKMIAVVIAEMTDQIG